MYLDIYEKRKYTQNLGKKWRSEVKDNDDFVLGSFEASDMIPSLHSFIAFLEAKKDSLAYTIKDRIEAIDESIEFEKSILKDLKDNPNCFKS